MMPSVAPRPESLRGKFKAFDQLVRVYDGKRGLHIVVLYLVVGRWRIPWSFRVWRGKDSPSPAQLGLKLLKGLPKALTKHFQVMILVDTAFGSVEFLHGIRKLKYHAIAGVRCDRKLQHGRSLAFLCKRGQQVRLVGLKFPVSVSWYYLKRDNGKLEKRFVLSTKSLKGSTITWWGKRRWQIEEAFNTAKRLLGLSYLWTGSINGVKLQVWATWLFYAILIDLADAVADELALPFDRISLEMVFRGLNHFNQAYAKGKATDPVWFFAAPENKNLDVVKTIRKKPQPLDLSPFPLPLTNTSFP